MAATCHLQVQEINNFDYISISKKVQREVLFRSSIKKSAKE